MESSAQAGLFTCQSLGIFNKCGTYQSCLTAQNLQQYP
jgi:hypothetical protein